MRLAHGEIGKGLNDYDAIFSELRRSADFLQRKIAEHWGYGGDASPAVDRSGVKSPLHLSTLGDFLQNATGAAR
ncbi:hypothetical protein [Blastopirellula retiformator]|uniref:Uncharacterized protein n=1 Tax=Blastopirellula retiformator TaxID=2527970 RepID=A0A5C5V974_9BACT|nr:hypothetical protein [Blastopirellula retiformator]TWT34409.1 hypothetical protein Enr8_18170 [Blastopirellula retiformator]